MKKFLKITLIGTVIIALICLVQKLDILGFIFEAVTEEQISNYSEYYFNQLNLDEKKMYIKIDEAVKARQEKVFLGTKYTSDIYDKIFEVLTAYFYDNPEYYYISNEYIVVNKDFKVFNYVTVQLDYLNDINEIEAKNKEIEIAMEELLNSCIQESMTDFEKEVAIHDALVNHVTYYEYQDMNDIPEIKHTAYAALVEKEAVCDGYSKAFKMLLEKVGIDSIIVSGEVDNVAHAWNVVELDDKYYHVDVTSDKLENIFNKYVVHTYFNVTDETISKTHTVDKIFEYPKCYSIIYDYYLMKDYYLNAEDNLYDKLKNIVEKQKKSNILEVKSDANYSEQTIIDTLYNLNFNNWRSNGQISVEYNKVKNIYIFPK